MVILRGLTRVFPGPPGQVKAIGGEKQGMNQGALGGILKELGYTEQQVCNFLLVDYRSLAHYSAPLGIQILEHSAD